MDTLKSGQTAPWTGEYSVVSRNGRTVGTIHVNKGDKLPPTQSDGDHFEYNKKS